MEVAPPEEPKDAWDAESEEEEEEVKEEEKGEVKVKEAPTKKDSKKNLDHHGNSMKSGYHTRRRTWDNDPRLQFGRILA